MLPDFRLLYKARVIKSMALAQKQTQKSMEQNRQPRSKPCNDGQLIYNKAGKNTCRKKKNTHPNAHSSTVYSSQDMGAT